MNPSVYDFNDYREFLRSWVAARPSRGRGEWKKMAAHLRVSTTMISQVLAGDRNLNQEMGSELAEYFGFSDEETHYFLLLIDLARAGVENLRKRLMKRVHQEQAKALELRQRLKPSHELSEIAKAVFYSDWIYSGVHNLSSIDRYSSAHEIAERLQVPLASVRRVIEFLVQNGLCREVDGQLEPAAQSTHAGADSPWVIQHHRNWRHRALECVRRRNEADLFYTGPMSISQETAESIRRQIPKFLEKVYKEVGPSPSEVVRCLNIDWFEY